MTVPASSTSTELPQRAPSRKPWIKSKHRLSKKAWVWLSAPTLVAVAVIVAKLVGCEWLVRSVTLKGLGPVLTPRVGHLFIVPIGALVVVVLRLTLNLGTLGPFRAILLAMAFESVGFGLGFVFFVLVTGVVMLLRPATRRMGLPYYGRVLTIVSVVAAIVVAVLLLASATGAGDLQRVAYFPIVVLALTGDAASRILAREGPWVVIQRVVVTLVAAAVIAIIAGLPPVRDTLVRFPELLVLQIVSVIVVCELFDIRLLERLGWLGSSELSRGAKALSKRRRKSGSAGKQRAGALAPATSALLTAALDGPLRVAVVRNRETEGFIGKVGGKPGCPHPEPYSRKGIQRILDALREVGYDAKAFQGDMTLLQKLAEYLPVSPETGGVRGIVLNLASGVQGDCPQTQIPAMLELAGVPYTGADARGHAVCVDRLIAKTVLRNAGVPTPAFTVHSAPGQPIGDLEFPLVVKSRMASSRLRANLVRNRAELDAAVAMVREQCEQDALVESYVDGREFTIGTLGQDPIRTLPIVELARAKGSFSVVSSRIEAVDEGTDGSPERSVRRCPAPIDESLERRLRSLSAASASACRARDYARVDVRLDRAGEPFVIQVHSMPSLGWGGSYVRAARHTGYGFSALLREIVESARRRTGAARTAEADAAPVGTGTNETRAL